VLRRQEAALPVRMMKPGHIENCLREHEANGGSAGSVNLRWSTAKRVSSVPGEDEGAGSGSRVNGGMDEIWMKSGPEKKGDFTFATPW